MTDFAILPTEGKTIRESVQQLIVDLRYVLGDQGKVELRDIVVSGNMKKEGKDRKVFVRIEAIVMD